MLKHTSINSLSLFNIIATRNFRCGNSYNHHLLLPHSSSQKRSTAYFSSSLDDALSDFLNRRRKQKRRHDLHKDLETSTLQVTRLNDVLISSRASLLDAAVGYTAGDGEREDGKRHRISMEWNELLEDTDGGSGLVPNKGAKAEIASAIQIFEEKELDRKERLLKSLDVWRESKLGKKTSGSVSTGDNTTSSTQEKKNKRWFVTEWFSNLRERNKKTSPYRIMAEQLQHEQELFASLNSIIGRDVKGGGVDSKIIMDIIRGSDSIRRSTTTKTSSNVKEDNNKKQYIYVLDFKGDMGASKVKNLSHEISAIKSLPSHLSPTEVIVRLKSPGGTVTGYGLASAELARLRQSSSKNNDDSIVDQDINTEIPSSPQLTICVDEIAASGGYLMACVGHQILSSPFAAIGSIGVIASTPNVSKRLNDEGVQVLQSTAGKYKRTVTPWTEPKQEEIEKLQQDVETIHEHFRMQVSTYRADKIVGEEALNEVCTGEVWYGEDAVKRGLVDDLITSEEYIQNKIAQGFEVLHVKQSISKPRLSLPWLGASNSDDLGAAFFGDGDRSWYRKLWSSMRQSKKMPNIRALDKNIHLLQDTMQEGVDDNVELSELLSITASLSPHQKRALLEAILFNSEEE